MKPIKIKGFRKHVANPDPLTKSLYKNLHDLVKCIRNFELGDYSPLMDEIFDSEYVIEKYEKKFGKTESK